MKTTAGRIVVGAVGCVFGVLAVFWLREATISRVERVPRDSRIVVTIDADWRGGETAQTLTERVEALLLTCRIEVRSDLVGAIEELGPGSYRATFTPTMDNTDRKQFRGCVQDWTIDGVRVEVESMVEVMGSGS